MLINILASFVIYEIVFERQSSYVELSAKLYSICLFMWYSNVLMVLITIW